MKTASALILALVATAAFAAPVAKVCVVGTDRCSTTDYSYLVNGPESRIMPVPATFSCPAELNAKTCHLVLVK